MLALVAIVAMAGGVYWVLKPQRTVSDYDLLSCLPPAAEIVVFQRSLETDWLRLRHSAWFRTMMSRPELKPFAHQHGFDKPELSDAERWILDLIGMRVLAGYVPDPQKPGRYSIFAFAPVGNRAQRLETIHRKDRKREFRRLWIARINAAVRNEGMTYSRFMEGLIKAGVVINRKMLSEVAIADAEGFKALIEKARAALV